MTKYINPYTDFGFKWLFGKEKNKAILIDFLNAVFDGMEVIEDLEYRPNEHLGSGPEDRHVIFDVYCVTKTGEHIIVEMQNVRQSAFRDRMLFYAAGLTHPLCRRWRHLPLPSPKEREGEKLLASSSGAWNFELKRVYSIGILNFTLDKADLSVPAGTRAVERTDDSDDNPARRYRRVIQLMDIDTKVIFSKTLTFIYVEMPNFSKAESELRTLLDKWLFAIKVMADTDDERPASLTGGAFDQFFEQARYACLSADEQWRYDRSLMDYWDVYAIEQTHYNEGFAEGERRGREDGERLGREAGIAEGKLQTLKALVREGLLSLEDAARSAGLSASDFKETMNE